MGDAARGCSACMSCWFYRLIIHVPHQPKLFQSPFTIQTGPFDAWTFVCRENKQHFSEATNRVHARKAPLAMTFEITIS